MGVERSIFASRMMPLTNAPHKPLGIAVRTGSIRKPPCHGEVQGFQSRRQRRLAKERPMPFKSAAIVIAMTMAVPAFAQTADDIKWINECVQDNKDEGAKEDVVLKYCTCMNGKMDDNEKASISD